MGIISASNSLQDYRLCGAAEFCVRELVLPPDQEAMIANCVSRYSFSTVSGITDLLNWLVFRISNMACALLGKQTDWDFAKKIILARALDLADGNDIFLDQPNNDLAEQIDQQAYAYIDSLSLKRLELCLKAQDLYLEVDEEMRQKSPQINLVNIMQKTSILVERVRDGIEPIEALNPNSPEA